MITVLSSEVIWLSHLQRFSTTGRVTIYGGWQEHQQAVEEEFGPENFVVVVRGLLDEAREVVDFYSF